MRNACNKKAKAKVRLRVKIGFLLLLSIGVFAHYECPNEPPAYFSLKHRESRGIGYKDGYTSVTGTLIPRVTDNFFPFIDGRLHIFNNGRFASNLGFGARYGLPWGTWALGANAYWDHREAKNIRIDGLGVGAEILSKNVDFRVNGYIPSGKTRSATLEFNSFSGNNILTQQRFYRGIPSVFGEVGVPVPIKVSFVDLYFAVGPYYLFERKIEDQRTIGKAWGIKGRLENQVLGGFSIAVEASYDHEFGAIVQGVAKLSFPLGARNIRQDRIYWKIRNRRKECRERATRDHILTQPVERNEIIPIDSKQIIAPLINPATGEPFSIIFVNNTNPFPGVGTFENPYWSLALAEANSFAGSLIYVFSGDGTTFQMDTGYVFKPNQFMSGSGIPLVVGPITVPAYTPGISPHATNTAGDAFTMANNAELAGFTVERASQDGINTANTTGVIIRENTIQNNTRHGIFSDSTIAGGGTITITENTIQNNGDRGIFYQFVNEDFLTITFNTITGNGTNGVDILGNFAIGGRTPSATISNNTISNNTGQGILYFFTRGTAVATINNNIIAENGVHGIAIVKISDPPTFDLATAVITNNQVLNQASGFDGIRLDSRGRMSVNVDGNTLQSVNGPTSNQLHLILAPGGLGANGQMCGRLVNNTVDTDINLENNQAQAQMQVEASNPPSLTSLEGANFGTNVTETVNPVSFVLPGTACP